MKIELTQINSTVFLLYIFSSSLAVLICTANTTLTCECPCDKYTYKFYWYSHFFPETKIMYKSLMGFHFLFKLAYEGLSKSYRTGRLERELQMVQPSATRCNCIAYFVSQSSEFCSHSPLCCFPTSIYCCCCLFLYIFSPETFGYTLVHIQGAATNFPESLNCAT
jgi:hypothetical protein